ncbi:hypothetical protein DL98DRAFT_536319 [Cadophora sp. DSE1049]|nr:hypothetical protein DL98DRAFT_536319 [Cadophora sp. DSE1049]
MYLTRAAGSAPHYPSGSPLVLLGQLAEVLDHARVYLAGLFGINDQPPGVFISVDRPVTVPGLLHGANSRVNLDGNPNISELQSYHHSGTNCILGFTRPNTGRFITLAGGPIQDPVQRNSLEVREPWVLIDRGPPTSALWQWVSIGFWDIGRNSGG